MFTNVRDDTCSVYDRDLRNERIYDHGINQVQNFRRSTDNFKQIYRSARRGLEQDVLTENKLRDLNHVLNSCNAYAAGIQQDRIESAPYYDTSCLMDALKPQYTRLPRIANHSFTYENPYRAQPGFYHFVTVPKGVQYPGRGMYAFDRKFVDTRQNAKDEILTSNKNVRRALHNNEPLNNRCDARPLNTMPPPY